MKKLFNKKYEEIITRENILNAWRQFSNGKKNKQDVSLFSMHLTRNIENLYLQLISKSYTHQPYIHFRINDPKPRDIHKASVQDRIVHHLLYNALYPYFDTKFIHDSYSCRFNKGTHKAINRFKHFYNQASKNNTKTAHVLKCDIRKFFANIDHEILKNILNKHITDIDILNLLANIINSFCTAPPSLWEGGQGDGLGLPLGNLTSQLLVNIYMNEFDQHIKHKLKIKYYIRYADDFVILHTDKNYLKTLQIQISMFLNAKLKLELHPAKVFIKTFAGGVDFLGWVHFPHHTVLRTATKNRMFRNLERGNYKEASVRSYLGMLGHGHAFGLCRQICTRSCLVHR